jgi:hypothetical protein
MGNALFHAESSAIRFGGIAEDYLRIHKFLDQSKLYIPDWRHRCLLHNNFGIALCEQFFDDFHTRPSDETKGMHSDRGRAAYPLGLEMYSNG